MPWICNGCQSEVREDDVACPQCSSPKTSWTLVGDKTRTFVFSRRGFHLLRARGGSDPAAEPPYEGVETDPAEQAPVVTKARANQLLANGQLPSPADVLLVRLIPRKKSDLTILVSPRFATRPAPQLEFPRERPADLPDGGQVLVPFLLTYGSDDPLPADAFPGVHVVDLTEDTPAGHAPTVQFSALGGAAKELPTGAGPLLQSSSRGAAVLEAADVHFHHDSAVLLPDHEGESDDARITGLAVIRAALAHGRENPSQQLLVCGHTDTTGSNAYNLELSGRRARAVRAVLVGDRDAWVAGCQEKHQVGDVQQIMAWARNVYGWDCDPGVVDGLTGPKTRAAVEAYQGAYNQAFSASIGVDGLVGPQTWGAVFDTYTRVVAYALDTTTDELGPWRSALEFLGDGAVGCGESHPVEGAGEDDSRSAANRRVELLFFDPEEVPALACHDGGACDPSACTLYGEQAEISFRRVPVEPIPYGTGTVTIRTDIGLNELEGEDLYRLAADDGTFEATLSSQDDRLPDDDWLDLRFEGVPTAARFTLTARDPDGNVETIFSGVSFASLHTLSSDVLEEDR